MRGMTLKSQGYCTKAAWLVTLYVAVNKENRHADLQITLSNVLSSQNKNGKFPTQN